MATSTRIRGNITPVFTGKIVGAAGTAVSYSDDLRKVVLAHTDRPDGDLTFAEAAQGLASNAVVTLTVIVSWDTAAIYAWLYENAGKEVEILWGPYGNSLPEATKPHFKVVGTLPNRPTFELEARRTPEGATTEIEITGDGPAETIIS